MRGETPRKRAVALRYDPELDPAPRVVAKGRGVIAEKILEVAKENDIPIHEDPDLVEILAAIDLGRLIPAEMYSAVAEILAFLYRVNDKAKRRAA
ncbi:MAG: EscU/YscU/HrcU family type III secretion system export apparatus switch protein [Candidatus Omnitrophica bacterium]|nr:EscU/YscU/HrcU family type III secretion system export apparatus switch protein [Candidatus Omnitrophota bacterium]MCA9418920.1 EscU/YscU/HrcU family type III secretion system export apparatus switch protein [Candidatus Omnitrophota bacterium]MCA9426489.1 EscU/YscU/HrcU family type III secretion system export apparatus switch protein [Candidatus Omnitrophota bacterium]MCA9433846.1 EscU/YscU/HrcU family type III secretion system export apparatus switch protein [Candidatus Omnitrophota bacteriu